MMRSMFAGVSGMKSHQMMMDVIGDNIANINSSGFKASRVVFQDTLSQLMKDGSAATATTGSRAATGAINPNQVGLGVKLSAVDSVVTQGAIQATGRPSDLAIQGSGYFALEVAGGTEYTRSGSFSLDTNNNLVDPTGGILLGQKATDAGDGTEITYDPAAMAADTPAIPLEIPKSIPDADGKTLALSTFSIGTDGVVNAVYQGGTSRIVGRVALATFDNAAGLIKAGNGHLRRGTASGAPILNPTGSGGAGTLAAGSLEMSNVDLAQEFTNMMIAQRGFQANSKVISTSDELLQELVNLKR